MRDAYIADYINIYKENGKDGSGAGLVDKAERIRLFGYDDKFSLLDYGCGWGAILSGINPKDYLGVDIVPQAIELARKEFPDRNFEVLEIGKLKTEPKDFAIALSVFSHALYSDVPDCLNDISSNLKTGGGAIIDILEGDKKPTLNIHYWNLDKFIEELAQVGLKVLDSKKYTSSIGYVHTYLKLTKI